MPPHKIEEALELSADVLQEKGAHRHTAKGSVLNGKFTANYCVFRFGESHEELATFLKGVTRRLSAHVTLFREIKTAGGRVELFVGWYSDRNSGGEVFDSELLEAMGSLGIDLSLDIYAEK